MPSAHLLFRLLFFLIITDYTVEDTDRYKEKISFIFLYIISDISKMYKMLICSSFFLSPIQERKTRRS